MDDDDLDEGDEGLPDICSDCGEQLDEGATACRCGYTMCPICAQWDIERYLGDCPEWVATCWGSNVWTPVDVDLPAGSSLPLMAFRGAGRSMGPGSEAWLSRRTSSEVARNVTAALSRLRPISPLIANAGEAWDDVFLGEFVTWGAIDDGGLSWVEAFPHPESTLWAKCFILVGFEDLNEFRNHEAARLLQLDQALSALAGMLFEPCRSCGAARIPGDPTCLEGCPDP